MTTSLDSLFDAQQPPPARIDEPARELDPGTSPADRNFRWLITLGGVIVLAIMGLVGIFLTYRAWQALSKAGWAFFTTQAWEPDSNNFGIAGILVGTILIALVAVAIAVPLAIGCALYISEYASPRLQRSLISLVDLMAAVPSVVYGIWGFYLLQPQLLVRGELAEGLPRWLATYFGWIPFLRVDAVDQRDPGATGSAYTSSTFIAGIIVAMMVTPIICSIMREVFSQAPVGEREGAYALGATRWGMIRAVVLPFGKGGMIGATMLGLGRALGETIGVFLIISIIYNINYQILEVGGANISSVIALLYGAATPFGTSALFAAGLTLFVVTLIVNFAASSIVARSRSGAESEA